MPSDNIGHQTTNKNKGSLWKNLTYILLRSVCFQIKNSHSDSNEIDFSVDWLLQTVKMLEKNNKVSQPYIYPFNHFSHFLLIKKMSLFLNLIKNLSTIILKYF